jgi:hypothetical protein
MSLPVTNRSLAPVVIVLGCLLAACLISPAWGQKAGDAPPPFDGDEVPKSKRHTLSASVEHSVSRLGSPTGVIDPRQGAGLPVERQVAEFEIPAGQIATDLKYSFADVKTGIESDKLRKGNIYSVTQRRYVGDQKTLGPGIYRFVVGGLPGAMGNLTYTTAPKPNDEVAADPPEVEIRTPIKRPPPVVPPPPPPFDNSGKKWCPVCKKYH